MTISGQSGQSLNLSLPPGLRQRRSSTPKETKTPSQVCAALLPMDDSPIIDAMAARVSADDIFASIGSRLAASCPN